MVDDMGEADKAAQTRGMAVNESPNTIASLGELRRRQFEKPGFQPCFAVCRDDQKFRIQSA
jgi:hypothetical protein